MTETEQMLTSILNCRRIDLLIDTPNLNSQQFNQYQQIKKRRTRGEPLQYILGYCDFMGIKLSLDNRALIPRPETEMMVDVIIQKVISTYSLKSNVDILELGTGSGNIAIALAKNIPYCHIDSMDISLDALELAAHNAEANGVHHKIDFICKDMISLMGEREEILYDVIVSNPPYIQTSQMDSLPQDVKFEPTLALNGGKNGLHFFQEIIKNSYRFLKPNGFLYLEIGDGQYEAIKEMFKLYPQYQNILFYKDYTKTDRIVEIHFTSY